MPVRKLHFEHMKALYDMQSRRKAAPSILEHVSVSTDRRQRTLAPNYDHNLNALATMPSWSSVKESFSYLRVFKLSGAISLVSPFLCH